MRHGTSSNNRRPRSRGNGRRGGGNQQRMQVFDSNGPDVRIRGTAHQVTEKYVALAKDAALSGDRVLSESYLQFAEHYQRVISSWEAEAQSRAPNTSDKAPEDTKQAPSGNAKDDGDLSLPSSILGEKPEVKSETRTAEAAS